jgi:hypothetical protein
MHRMILTGPSHDWCQKTSLQLFRQIDLNCFIHTIKKSKIQKSQCSLHRGAKTFRKSFSPVSQSPATFLLRWTMATPKKWGKADDAKLANLFQKGIRAGGASSTDLNSKNIHHIIRAYFPNREYKNFAPLFRSKARAWNIDQTLTGQRSKCVLYFPDL